MRFAWLLLALVACHPGAGDDYPIIPQGGDDGTLNPMADAATPADGTSGDGGMLVGRVCLTQDLRQPTPCAGTGVADLVVTLGTSTATTVDDGSFMMVAPGGTSLVWHVSGTTSGGDDLVPSDLPLGTTHIIPALTSDRYLDIKNSNAVIENAGEGSVVVYATSGGLPVPGATATIAPTGSYLAMGDTTNALNWVQGATGALGASWIPGATAGAASVTLTLGSQHQTVSLPVVDGGITFATVVFP